MKMLVNKNKIYKGMNQNKKRIICQNQIIIG